MSPRASTKVKTTTVEEKEIPVDGNDMINAEPLPATTQFSPAIMPVEENISPEEEELRRYFEGLGGSEVVIKICKYDTSTNRPRFMQDTDLEGASESYIQANWGEGRYLLRAYKEGRVLGAKTVHIGPPLNKNTSVTAVPVAPVIATPAAMGMDPLLQLQIEQMREDARTNREILMELVKSNMGGGGNKSGAMELAEVMAILKPVLTPPAAQGGSMLEMLSQAIPLVRQLIDLGANGGAAEKPSFLSTVKDLAPDVIKAVGSMMQNRQPAQPPQYPSQMPAAQPMNQPVAIQGIAPDQLGMLRSAIGFLKTRAAKNASPETFINYVLETLDDEQSMAVAKLLDRPFEEVASIDPEILSPVYRKWFEDFFGGLKDALSESDAPAGDGSNAGDAPDNAGPGDPVNPIRSANP